MAPPASSRRRLPRAPAGTAMTASCEEVSRIIWMVAWTKGSGVLAGSVPVNKSLIYIVYIIRVRCPAVRLVRVSVRCPAVLLDKWAIVHTWPGLRRCRGLQGGYEFIGTMAAAMVEKHGAQRFALDGDADAGAAGAGRLSVHAQRRGALSPQHRGGRGQRRRDGGRADLERYAARSIQRQPGAADQHLRPPDAAPPFARRRGGRGQHGPRADTRARCAAPRAADARLRKP